MSHIGSTTLKTVAEQDSHRWDVEDRRGPATAGWIRFTAGKGRCVEVRFTAGNLVAEARKYSDDEAMVQIGSRDKGKADTVLGWLINYGDTVVAEAPAEGDETTDTGEPIEDLYRESFAKDDRPTVTHKCPRCGHVVADVDPEGVTSCPECKRVTRPILDAGDVPVDGQHRTDAVAAATLASNFDPKTILLAAQSVLARLEDTAEANGYTSAAFDLRKACEAVSRAASWLY